MLVQIGLLRRLIHLFVLRPDVIPLPRVLCILRYKSLDFLDNPTISENEFWNALQYVHFTDEQVHRLQNWLDQKDNKQWIKDHSVDEVAQALSNASVKAYPNPDNSAGWKDELSRYLK
jgi:hypothetical protein